MTSEPSATSGDGCPWLEYFPEGGNRVETTPLTKGVCLIGRSETADIQINSTKVSREHAKIAREGDKYLIRDLQSTNGTFVNGQRIDETELTSGDAIIVADTEFAFLTDAESRLRRMATQQMTARIAAPGVGDTHPVKRDAQEAVLALRAAHEQLRQRFTPVELSVIVQMPEATPFAYVTGRPPTPSSSAPASPFLHAPSHALAREQEMRRFATIQRCAALGDCSRVIVSLEPWEVHETEGLLWHFEAMASSLQRKATLFVGIPANAVVDRMDVQKFCRDLQEIGIEVCARDFVGGVGQISSLCESNPQILIFGSEMWEGLDEALQRRNRLDAVVGACHEMNIRTVATGIKDSEMATILMDMGVDLFEQNNDDWQRRQNDSGRSVDLPAVAVCS